jgi:putative ABC transport system ATP-binding protein
VFQFFQLLPTLTTAENVMLPMDFANARPPQQRRARALELLARVGIGEQADKLPAALSGGQQQRAAIARALANDPPLVIADEPTGNLDSVTARAVLGLLRGMTDLGTTVVMATHEHDTAGISRAFELADGRLVPGGTDASR